MKRLLAVLLVLLACSVAQSQVRYRTVVRCSGGQCRQVRVPVQAVQRSKQVTPVRSRTTSERPLRRFWRGVFRCIGCRCGC